MGMLHVNPSSSARLWAILGGLYIQTLVVQVPHVKVGLKGKPKRWKELFEAALNDEASRVWALIQSTLLWRLQS